MTEETVVGRGTSLSSMLMSCGGEGDELAILPIVVFDFVSLFKAVFSPLAYVLITL
jgi:hypothetical protein